MVRCNPQGTNRDASPGRRGRAACRRSGSLLPTSGSRTLCRPPPVHADPLSSPAVHVLSIVSIFTLVSIVALVSLVSLAITFGDAQAPQSSKAQEISRSFVETQIPKIIIYSKKLIHNHRIGFARVEVGIAEVVFGPPIATSSAETKTQRVANADRLAAEFERPLANARLTILILGLNADRLAAG